MKPLQFILTALLLGSMTLTGCQSGGFRDWTETGSAQAFATSLGPVTRTESTAESRDAVQQLRTYTDTAGCTVYMGRIQPQGAACEGQTAAQYVLTGAEGTVRSYSVETGQWSVTPLENKMSLGKGMYFVRTDQSEAVLVTPLTYTGRENGMIEYLPDYDGALSIQKTSDGYTLSLSVAALPGNSYSDYLALCADSFLIDWDDPDVVARWTNYRFTDSNRWCYDGYYYTAPSDYYPSGENYFHPLPAAYIAAKMARDTGEPASRALGLAMIDIMREQQNEYGFIPSQAGSGWLNRDYDIDPGYFDTRFNTSFWQANIDAAETFGVSEWLDATIKYADFLMGFAADHHFSFGSAADEGWLVEDYWHENGKGKTTHCSLNHHAAEAVFLYRLTNATGDGRYAAFADRLVRGIELTAGLWPMEDNNLYYAYLPDGTMMTGDYPYLTYNDLLDLQSLYVQRHGSESEAIASLIRTKLSWINANGVTGYNQSPTV